MTLEESVKNDESVSSSSAQEDTPGSKTVNKISDLSRADYTVYAVGTTSDGSKAYTTAVIVEAKMVDNTKISHVIAQVSLFVFKWVLGMGYLITTFK